MTSAACKTFVDQINSVLLFISSLVLDRFYHLAIGHFRVAEPIAEIPAHGEGDDIIGEVGLGTLRLKALMERAMKLGTLMAALALPTELRLSVPSSRFHTEVQHP